jgi:hypothetical protein
MTDSIKQFSEWWKEYGFEITIGISILFLIGYYIFVTRKITLNSIVNPSFDPDTLDILSIFKKKKNGHLRKRENECRRIIEDLFQREFPCVRPNFLKNPLTGKNLELDLYNNDLRLAFEVDGAQHTKYNTYFHSSYKDFQKQVERDRFKDRQCEFIGITLIRIPPNIQLSKLDEYIESELRKRDIQYKLTK